MSMLKKLSALFRGTAHDAAQGVVDANALRILDQEIRDADNAQGKARDDLAGLVARRRMAENEMASFHDQIAKYESSARSALGQGKTDLAREVAVRIAELEVEISSRGPLIEDMKTAETRLRTAIASTDQKIETLRREIDIVKVNESVQRAQTSVALTWPALSRASARPPTACSASSSARPCRKKSCARIRPWKTAAPAPIWTPSCATPASCPATLRPTMSWPV